jgi:hypothetical protein
MNRDEFIQEYKEGRRNFREAYLHGVSLYGADLRGVSLYGSDLSEADLREDLSGACLSGANLRDANLRGAYLRGAILDHNDTIIYACLGGYQMHIQQMFDGIRVIAGCRYFTTVEEAEACWAEGNEKNWTVKTAEYGARQRRMLAFLAYEARQRGWIS